MEEETLKSIDKKMDILIKLLAGNLIQGKSKTDAIIMLANFSIEASAIADIVQTSPKAVYARLSEQKKKTGSTSKKTRKPKETK